MFKICLKPFCLKINCCFVKDPSSPFTCIQIYGFQVEKLYWTYIPTIFNHHTFIFIGLQTFPFLKSSLNTHIACTELSSSKKYKMYKPSIMSLLSFFQGFEAGAGSREQKPEAGRLRNPQTPSRYIIARVNESIYFLITLGTLLKSLGLYILYFELLEPGASTAPKPQLKVFFEQQTI